MKIFLLSTVALAAAGLVAQVSHPLQDYAPWLNFGATGSLSIAVVYLYKDGRKREDEIRDYYKAENVRQMEFLSGMLDRLEKLKP